MPNGEKIIKLIPPAAGVGVGTLLMAEGQVGERIGEGVQWHLHIGDVSSDQQGVNDAVELVATKPPSAEVGAMVEDAGLVACAGLATYFLAKAAVKAIGK